jgi:hypothetical protein
MTIHDQHTELDQSAENADLATEPVVETHDHSTDQRDLQSGGLHQTDFQPTEPARPASAAPAETSTEQALFADHELSELQSRWADVQAAFVDDPKDSVQQADGLVNDVVEQITTNFSQARSRLEEQWARGEEASTEDLRVALKSYREFFQRLLTV